MKRSVVIAAIGVWICAHASAQTDAGVSEPSDAGSEPDADVVEVVVRPPQLLEEPSPVWPESVEEREPIEVHMELLVGVDGSVSEVRVDATEDAFRRAALIHAAGLRFVPAVRVDGQGETAVEARIGYRVRFEPPSEPEPEPQPEPAAEPESEPEPDLDPGFGAHAAVEGSIEERPEAAASEQRFDLRALRAVPRRSAEELATLSPGLVLVSHGGEGKVSSLYLRGFDAGEGQDVEVLVDGIPLNEPSNAHLHGYADTHFLIPELIGALRVLPGPFDPAQGDFALAGTLEYRLGLDEPGLHVTGGYGSYGRKRALLLYGEDEHRFVGFEVQSGRGFGPNRAHRNVRLLGRWGAESSVGEGRLRWGLTLASHALRFDTAGVVRADRVQAGLLPCSDTQFFCTDDPNQGGAASRHLMAAHLDWRKPGRRYRQVVWAQLRRSRFRENFTGHLVDERGDGLDELTDGVSVGVRGDYVVERAWNGRAQQIELGVLARHDRGTSRMWRVREVGTEPHTVVFDDELALTHVAAYAAGVLRVPRLTLRAGVRLAGFAFSIVDRNQPEVDRVGERVPAQSSDAFGVAVLPKLTARVRLVDQLAWVTSVGRGSRSSDGRALSEAENAPFAQSRTLESGFAYVRDFDAVALDVRAGGHWTHVDRDLLFDPEAGRNVPLGETQRFGTFVSLRSEVEGWADVVGSFAWNEAHRVAEGEGELPLTSGPRLPYVPRFVGRLDAALRRRVAIRDDALTLGIALGASLIGRKPLPNEELSQRIFVVDAAASARWRFVEVGISARNLFDMRYRQLELQYESRFDDDEFGSLRPARHFAAGPPLEVMATLTLHLDLDRFRDASASDASASTETP